MTRDRGVGGMAGAGRASYDPFHRPRRSAGTPLTPQEAPSCMT